MIPLPEEKRNELWSKPGLLPGFAQHWADDRDSLVYIRPLPRPGGRATVYARLDEYAWRPDPETHPVYEEFVREFAGAPTLVLRGFLFHDQDWSEGQFGGPIRDKLDSHKGDSEAFVFLFPLAQEGDPRPTYVLTRNHTIWHVYKAPGPVSGRFWIEIESMGHGLSLVENEATLSYPDLRLYEPGCYDLVDMAGPKFVPYELSYWCLFHQFGIDPPHKMGDRRLRLADRGGDIGLAWQDPYEFIYRLMRDNQKIM
jgi:hypothetical protein